MARGETAGGLAVLFAGLFVAGLLIYWRVTRNERNRATVARLEAEVAGWEQPVREWSGSSSCAEPLISEFLDLRDRCRKDRDIRTKLATLDEATAVTRAQVESARAELALGETALRGFLQESGAADAAGFRSRLRMFQERADLSALIRDRENRIGALGETLSSGRYEELRRESAHTLELLANVRARRDEAIGEQRLAEAARRQIAESTAIPTIKAELEWLRSELALSIRAWRVARLARELVGRTLQEFTRSRQPAVLEMASEAFARVTAGAYKRILQADTVCRQEDARNRPYRQADTVFHQPDARDRPYRQADTVFHQPDARNKPYRQADTVFHQPDARDKPYRQSEDGESLVAIDRDGQRKRPEELSRGTAEQLYLCLRLALAAEFARRTAALPLVMDDVLVNFDPERAAAVARELAHFSRQHQVLIFTCHPETARLFAEAAPGTGVIRMGRDTRLSAAK